MSVVLFKTFEVVLALSVLVFVHELGHFLFAKLFGIRVDKFFIFFDAGGKKLWSKKIGETEYGIGWLPLGGYCKIAGMVDESFDIASLESEPQEWEFRAKPAWQRFFVMFGGVLFNFIFAILLYIGIVWGWGTTFVSNEDAHIYPNDLAEEMGFKVGDHIIAYDDYLLTDFSTLQAELLYRDVEKAIVYRGSDTVKVYIDHAFIPRALKSPSMFDLAFEFRVDTVLNQPLASNLYRGDKIIGVNGTELPYFQDIRKALLQNCDEDVTLMVQRGEDTLGVVAHIDTLGRVGVYTAFPEGLIQNKEYNFIEAIPAGAHLAISTLGDYVRGLKLFAQPETEAYKSVGSFISIGRIFPQAWNWQVFLSMLAFLSIILAVMNILPIPALDGGHILFLLIEIVTGHKLSTRAMLVLQTIGMFLLLALMALACGNDIASIL